MGRDEKGKQQRKPAQACIAPCCVLWQLHVWLVHVLECFCAYICLRPIVNSGTCLSWCQAQPVLAKAQPFPSSQELQLTFLWRQRKMSIMKSPSKYGLRCIFARTPGGSIPISCVPSAHASSSLKAALFMATNAFQNVGGL